MGGICLDLIEDIAGKAVEASQEMERVCSDMDFITLTCPETEDSILQSSPMNVVDDEEDELLGPGSPALSVELEEREVLTLLESLNDLAKNDKFAFRSLQSLYDGNLMEELFDSSNKPSPGSLSSIRRFIGNLVYEHFGNSQVQKPNLSLLLCHSMPPISLHLIPFIRPFVIRTLWSGRLARNWEWSLSLRTALRDQKRASLPFWIISPFCFLFYCRGLARAGRRV